jgi:hypothetical protein
MCKGGQAVGRVAPRRSELPKVRRHPREAGLPMPSGMNLVRLIKDGEFREV